MKEKITVFKKYLSLIKPGIVRGNMITATGGFLFASKGSIDLGLLLAMALGLSFVIASGCVFNNVIDISIDSKMKRTLKRALVTGEISVRSALIFGAILLAVGSFLLGYFTNSLALLVALFGLLAYVVLYGVFKRKSVRGTEIGSISGAIPPVVGYVAVTGNIDAAACVLFLILVLWQMPHFYAIGIFRRAEYKAAGIPILPVKEGVALTKRYMLVYIVLFTLATPLLTIFGGAGVVYSIVMVGLGLYWLLLGIKGFNIKDDDAWARQLFGLSLIVLLVFSALISFDTLLP